MSLHTRIATLRRDVRTLLQAELDAGSFEPRCDQWMQGFSPEFSRKLGARGWLGMTWPRRYGGREAHPLERYALLEELLAAGAPVAAHWFAERQTGPLLLRYGTERQRMDLLPSIARGETYVSIGMSEPASGSDLASVRTRAVPDADGWRVTGQKVWTTHAHRAHYIVALVRTSDDRHAGLTQMIIPLSAEGVTVRPIETLTGAPEFCEVFFDDVQVPREQAVGEVGAGWEQVTSELAAERSGPERFLSAYPLLSRWIACATSDGAVQERLGRQVSRLWALRALSAELVQQLGEPDASVPMAHIAAVKDRGTLFEQGLIDAIRREVGPYWTPSPHTRRMLEHAVLSSPSFTIRGGTNEILRSVVGRALGGGR